MGCIKLNILDEQYKKTEIKVSYRREKLTSNFCGVDAGKYLLNGLVISEYRQDWMLDAIPKFYFNSKMLDEESGLYYYEARHLDPKHGTFNSRDQQFEKYFFISPYAYCANNPINSIDPDGKDIIVLRNSTGAHGTGHAALLVGSEKKGWTYISKDGYTKNPFGSKSKYVVQKFKTLEDFKNSPHNFELEEGTHSTSEGKEASSFKFKLDENGNKIQRYDQALFFATEQADGTSTDAKTIQAATNAAKSDYKLGVSDCSDVITAGLNVSKDSKGEQIKNGETTASLNPLYDFYTERPNTKYNKIASRNKSSAVKYDIQINQ